jgi:ribonuclease T1
VTRVVENRMLMRALAAILAGFLCLSLPVSARGQAPGAPAAQEISTAELPREARDTIALIRKGGPFPHERDGMPFGNFEKILPQQARGYYREYTVRTPGVNSRGARRIVSGKASELYYTDDHYQSFRRIKEP